MGVVEAVKVGHRFKSIVTTKIIAQKTVFDRKPDVAQGPVDLVAKGGAGAVTLFRKHVSQFFKQN